MSRQARLPNPEPALSEVEARFSNRGLNIKCIQRRRIKTPA